MTTAAVRRGRRKGTAREIAEKWGRSERTVRATMAEARSDYEGRAQERRRRIVELADQGLTGAQIARELEVSPALVSTRLKEASRTHGDESA